MTTTSPSTRTRIARLWQPLGVVVLGFIVVLLFLIGDSAAAANQALGWAVGALVVVSLASGRPKSVSGTGPYALYALGLLLSLVFSWSGLSLVEVGRQALFLGLIFAVANLRLTGRMQSLILTLVLACTAVVVALALEPKGRRPPGGPPSRRAARSP